MKRYKQISYEERLKIAELKQLNCRLKEISLALNRPKSTISRELRRNEAPPGCYWPDRAESLTKARRHRGSRINRNCTLKDEIETKLRCEGWTPEQIAGWLKHRQTDLPCVSHESIYQWIYEPAQKKEKLWKFLPRHKAKRGPRKSRGAKVSRIPNRVSIHDRPKRIETKKEFGHWEGDLMSFLKNSQHSLVLRERKTMFTKSVPLSCKKAQDTALQVIDLLKDLPPKARQSMTYDNGGEFAAHERSGKELNLKSYFCDPYASWQKGGVENTNGRLRRDLPRNTNIKNMTKEDFNEIIDNYNNTPRKKLGWLTPQEAFNINLNRVALRT